MEKRYQVFVSSTYVDLLEARQEVMQALLELDCMPSGMELFPAADDDQWTLIKRVIDDCDYYIVIIAGRYGSTGQEGKSYTQMEYEYAIECGKPVIAFLHKEPGKIAAEHTETDPDNAQKLQSFRELAEKKMVRYWTSPAELGSAVSRSLIKLIKNNPAIGWIRADALPSEDTTEEILRLRKQIETLEDQIEKQRTGPSTEVDHLAQGDDPFELKYTFEASLTDQFWSGQTYQTEFEVTWEQLFARLSPLMIDEAADRDLRRELNRMVEEVNRESLEAREELTGYTLRQFDVNTDDFNTIKVQFLALQLIEKSIKNRSVKDKQNYWTLTKYGERIMTRLRAVKRPGHEDSTPAPSNKALNTDAGEAGAG